MSIKKISERPKVTDTILLEITTPDADGCFSANPYKVDNVIVYYVDRNFLGTNYGEYTATVASEEILNKLVVAEKKLCDNPTFDALVEVEKIKEEIKSSSQHSKFYYKDRTAVKIIGNEGTPAWLSSDEENSPLVLESEDAEGNSQFGRFSYEWDPQGSIREGDYFICWTWTPLAAGESLSDHVHFVVEGDGQAVSAIPSHATPEGKYETLLDRYLPEMYKTTLTDNDITPEVTDKLNKSVAKGFTFIEDMANQIIDLFDANALHESMLAYLSNTFAIRLRSSDPTLWRRQIKEAIPLFKKKGTLDGLKDAFAQSGMVLNAFVQYWQIVSPYTWIDTFKVTDSPTFDLSKDNFVESDNADNFGLWVKRAGEDDYLEALRDHVSFETGVDGVIRMTWIGDELSSNAVTLYEGDTVKVMYQYKEITESSQQVVEEYIRSLPLMDQRNEDDQEFPPKNWNVKLIEEDDPLFPVLVPVRHPFADPLMFGQIRTEFAYSENIYNADEYNGSTRPSFDACHIDKRFLDPCGACLSSCYNVDIGVEELSNDRMLEAQDILREYTPFHANIHSINFTGEVNEFVQPPTEQIDTLITIDHVQFVLSGNSNPFFGRSMEGALNNWVIGREDLTNQLTVLSGKLGTAYNDHVSFISPDHSLSALGVISNNHILEILSPSANAGTYTIDEVQGNVARVSSPVVEPLDKTAFTFVLSNKIYSNYHSYIVQKDLVKLQDDEVDFDEIGVKTQWDVANTIDYDGGAWKVVIPAYSSTAYEIVDIQDGILIIDGDSDLPTSDVTDVSYELFDDNDESIATSTTGEITVQRRGRVDINDSIMTDMTHFIKAGDYLLYDGTEYRISDTSGDYVWIEDYSDGDASGVEIETRRRLVVNGVGYFGYRGLRLTTFADHEAEFEMVNGTNPPPSNEITDDSKFKENFMFKIGEEYYKIASIDKKEVVLEGREQDWMTQSAGGSAVAYSIIHFPKKQVNVGFVVFDHLDRDGQDPVIREVWSEIDQDTAITALSSPSGSSINESVSQEEGISITIETRNGEIMEGNI